MIMDWTPILTNIIEGICGLAFTALSLYVTYFINKHIKDEKAKAWALSLSKIILSAVQSVQQTYVDNIKGTDAWNAETQKIALSKALAVSESQLSEDMKKWISENYGDVTAYLTELIEAQISALK